MHGLLFLRNTFYYMEQIDEPLFIFALVKKLNDMKTTKTTKTKETSWALPGEPIGIGEFKAGIKEVEKGSFMTLDELKKSVEEWKKSQDL